MRNFLMDLQLFATTRFHPEGFEGTNPLLEDEAGGVEEVPIDEEGNELPEGSEAPQEGITQGQPVAPPQEGQQAPQQVELTEEPNPGEDIQAYLERMRQDILERLPGEAGQPEEQQGPSPEELAQQNEQWLEQFYENPMEQVQQLAEQIANEKLKPIMQEREQMQRQKVINDNIAEFKQSHPDMSDYVPDMVEIFNQMPELENHPQALQIAYSMAKGKQFDSVPKTIDDHLKDETQIDKLLENEQIRNKLVQKLMNEKKTSPPVMGTGGKQAGSAALANPKKITNYRDATKAWLAQDD